MKKYLHIEKIPPTIKNELLAVLTDEFRKKVQSYCYEDFYQLLETSYAQEEESIRRREFAFFDNYVRRKTRSGGLKIAEEFGIVHAPYFLADFGEICLEIDAELRKDRNLQKKVLEKIAPEIAQFPSTSLLKPKKGLRRKFELLIYHIQRLLERILKLRIRRARVYVDIDENLRKSKKYRKMITSILLDDTTKARGYFNQEAVKQLLMDHLKRRKNAGRIIARLFDFEVLYRLFIDRDRKLQKEILEKFSG